MLEIESLELESETSDLDSLKPILKDKKIIALGESTPGASEFYRLKSRMIKYLVEELGYRKLVLDANVSDVKIVDDYINGNGNIEDSIWELRPFPWVAEKLEDDREYKITPHTYLSPYTTEEFKNILEWMKEYNSKVDRSEKIELYGIGIENPKKSVEDLIDYMSKVDNENEEEYRKKFRNLVMVNGLDFKYAEARPLGLLRGYLEELNEKLDLNRDRYIDISSQEEYQASKKNINTSIQWIEYSLANLNRGMDLAIKIKEEYMFENVKWILEKQNENKNDKIILWSNNKHISKDTKNYTSMGMHLDEEFEDDYYALGLEFSKGIFRAYGVNIWGTPISNFIAKFHIDKSKEDYFSYTLEKAGIPIYFLDFEEAQNSESIKEVLSTEQKIHNASLMYPGKLTPTSFLPYWTKQYLNEVPIKSYDGILFVNEISETKGIHDKRDTKIDNGDKAMLAHYRDLLSGQGGTILTVVLVIVLIAIWLIKKWEKRKTNPGAKYPGSRRWD